MRILTAFGTRPEIVKLAPVVAALRSAGHDVRAVATGQHDDPTMSDSFFDDLALVPDVRHELPSDEAQRVGGLVAHAYGDVATTMPDVVVVLGDTHTVPAYSLAARRFGVAVAHLEAGLRSFNPRSLEETNRRVGAAAASLHLAPTELAARFLRDEGVEPERIQVVGNPITDVLRRLAPPRPPLQGRTGVVVTAHRATNVDHPDRLGQLVELLRGLAAELPPVRFPVHPRTRARLDEAGALGALEQTLGLHLEAPLPYTEMLHAIAAARVVVTDSGGLQEEASWLGVPVVVLRTTTPRWEGVLAGTTRLAGLDAARADRGGRARLTVRARARGGAPLPIRRRTCRAACRRCSCRGATRRSAVARRATARPRAPTRGRARRIRVSAGPQRVAAVCFDLDDTLYPQEQWLHGAWDAVAARAAMDGVDEAEMRLALRAVAAEGSDRGRIIDRALMRLGAAHVPVAPLVAAFRGHDSGTLEPYAGVRSGLDRLAPSVPLGIVSDGDPQIQRSKLDALGLSDAFDVIVWSDEHGREHRKPHPLPFALAVELLGVEAGDVVYIGDRPDKDVVGAAAAGMVPIRVRTGEWHHQDDRDECWVSVATCADAMALVAGRIDQAGSTATSTRNSRSPGASR